MISPVLVLFGCDLCFVRASKCGRAGRAPGLRVPAGDSLRAPSLLGAALRAGSPRRPHCIPGVAFSAIPEGSSGPPGLRGLPVPRAFGRVGSLPGARPRVPSCPRELLPTALLSLRSLFAATPSPGQPGHRCPCVLCLPGWPLSAAASRCLPLDRSPRHLMELRVPDVFCHILPCCKTRTDGFRKRCSQGC